MQTGGSVAAWRAASLSGLSGLERVALPVQAPGHGEVRVRLYAASLNYRDLLILDGVFAAATVDGLIPLSDAAGEVVEIGEGVWRTAPGDRVALTFNREWIGGDWEPAPDALGRGGGSQGVARTEIVVRQEELVRLPAHLDYAQGACLPCAAVTAWSALRAGPPLLPGHCVLTHGSGGVSIFAIQLARAFGARVFATTTSPEKADRLRAIGAEDVFDSGDPDWPVQLAAKVGDPGDPGVDRVVETVGGDSMAASLQACRQGAHISLVGLQRGAPQGSELQFYKGISTSVVRVGSRQDFVAMNRAIEAHGIRPVIDRIFDFADLEQALGHLRTGGQLGKIVIAMNEGSAA